ncbi:MAG: hypothetical protein OQK82_02730 [Candidatus Pacearchaeota archaeon]|nr:hypothetical protein [Candidatus Pacearchaeota archaeon]
MKHIEWLKEQPPFKNSNYPYYKVVLKQWYICIDYLNSDDRINLIPEFINHTEKIDVLRWETLLNAIPELKPLYSYNPEKQSCSSLQTSGT